MSQKLKILVADDNHEFCQNMADILGMAGHEVICADDGFRAMESVKHDGFDLVIMDVKMPVMNGVEAFMKIREIRMDMPVIMMSAYAVEDLVKEALREGAFGFLKKPLEFTDLDKLIENAIGKGALVLVVDDDQDFCANIQDVLSEKGYRVSIAYDGNMALQMACQNKFDIMLLDLKLPPLNGLETYLAIREKRPNVIVFAITGYPKEMGGLVKKMLQENAYICLEKPINMDHLISLLEEVYEQKARGVSQKP
jgi:two-component system response regulator HydG